MTRRTLGFYGEHPRAFEAARAAWDERELDRYLAEQDELAADVDRREGWRMRTDLPAAPALSKKHSSQNTNEEAA